MPCQQCVGIEEEFSGKRVAWELKRYRKRGPRRTTRMLLDALKQEGVEGMTLLDIGGGVGMVQHALVEAGAAHATNVDAASDYLAAAREEAERRGLNDRFDYRHGDFVEIAPDVAPADVVTLDRVICCYPDADALVGHSAERARRLYGVVYPRRTWWTRIGFTLINAMQRLRRRSFRAFLHAPAAIDALVRAEGLAPRYHGQTLMWRVDVYRRT